MTVKFQGRKRSTGDRVTQSIMVTRLKESRRREKIRVIAFAARERQTGCKCCRENRSSFHERENALCHSRRYIPPLAYISARHQQKSRLSSCNARAFTRESELLFRSIEHILFLLFQRNCFLFFSNIKDDKFFNSQFALISKTLMGRSGSVL